jgi:hypothetical protein
MLGRRISIGGVSDASPVSEAAEPPLESAAPPSRQWHGAAGVVGLFGACVLAGALVSPLAAWLWVTLSNPPKVPLSPGGGVYLGEQALNAQSGVTLWFIVLGAIFGAVAGLVVGWFGKRFGWFTVVAVLLFSVTGALLSGYLGQHVFGADPRDEVVGAKVGDLIQVGVSLDTKVAYLGWPIGALVGVLAAISGWSNSGNSPESLDTSSTL